MSAPVAARGLSRVIRSPRGVRRRRTLVARNRKLRTPLTVRHAGGRFAYTEFTRGEARARQIPQRDSVNIPPAREPRGKGGVRVAIEKPGSARELG